MSVVSLLPSTWNNSDGLSVRFPGSAATKSRGGVYPMVSGGNMVEVYISLPGLPTQASGNQQIVLEDVVIPNGAFIEKVSVFVEKETTGSNANLDVGLVKTDRSTELDFNGLLAAADDFNSGTDLGGTTDYTRGAGTVTTEGGALIGTILAFDGILTANAETADWTAGIVRVRVYYHMPRSADI